MMSTRRQSLPPPVRLTSQPKPTDNAFRLLANPYLPYTALCEYVNTDANPIIYEAQLVESRVYIERGTRIAPHRKTILRVQERNGKLFWLQLERKPTSGRALVMGLGTTAANDQVHINRPLWLVPFLLIILACRDARAKNWSL